MDRRFAMDLCILVIILSAISLLTGCRLLETRRSVGKCIEVNYQTKPATRHYEYCEPNSVVSIDECVNRYVDLIPKKDLVLVRIEDCLGFQEAK